jgi:uncharacterized membrane protein YoaK (UPF0700 family)
MSTPRKTLRNSVKDRLTDVTTGLYLISATCGLVDAVCFLALAGVFAEMMTGNLRRFGTVWPLVLTSIAFSLAMIPLMFGQKPQ